MTKTRGRDPPVVYRRDRLRRFAGEVVGMIEGDWHGGYAFFNNPEKIDEMGAKSEITIEGLRRVPLPDIQRCSMLTHQLAQTGHSSMAQRAPTGWLKPTYPFDQPERSGGAYEVSR